MTRQRRCTAQESGRHKPAASLWNWSGREDLNLRPPAPKAGALTSLRYAPTRTPFGYHRPSGKATRISPGTAREDGNCRRSAFPGIDEIGAEIFSRPGRSPGKRSHGIAGSSGSRPTAATFGRAGRPADHCGPWAKEDLSPQRGEGRVSGAVGYFYNSPFPGRVERSFSLPSIPWKGPKKGARISFGSVLSPFPGLRWGGPRRSFAAASPGKVPHRPRRAVPGDAGCAPASTPLQCGHG